MRALKIELEREEDGRWIADATWLPGVLAYGSDAPSALEELARMFRELLGDEDGDE